MARTYHAEYVARQERAIEVGFSGYSEQRVFRSEHIEELAFAKESLAWRELHGTDVGLHNEKQMNAFYEQVLQGGEFTTITGITPDTVTGAMRHEAVAYFMEWEGYDESEAVAAMRDLYGTSG